jgi:hypothetical protein
VDSVAAGPTFEAVLVFGCGCREVWMTYQALEEPVTVVDLPCLPDCWQCAQNAPCATRQTMQPIYAPAVFTDVQPVRKRFVRMKLASA